VRSLYDGDLSGSLASQVRDSPLATLLVQLPTQVVVAASPSAAELLLGPDEDPSGLVGIAWPDLTTEPATTLRLLQQLTDREIDGYQHTPRMLRRSGLDPLTSRVVVKAHHFPGESPLAVAVLQAAQEPTPDGPAMPLDDRACVMGLMSDGGLVTDVTASARTVLGLDPDEIIGTKLLDYVHPDDVPDLLFGLGHAAADCDAAWTQLRWRRAGGEWRLSRTAISPVSSRSTSAIAFVIVGDGWMAGEGSREQELEATLSRVAREISAAIAYKPKVATTTRSPAFARLTRREQEVVNRLLAGDRVPAIARTLFLSPSTVRNHLHAAYRKTGVNSQQELVDYLRGTQI
jgi:DNA-binding CsgD family transcriptional regulator/PAS domain-containing protein